MKLLIFLSLLIPASIAAESYYPPLLGGTIDMNIQTDIHVEGTPDTGSVALVQMPNGTILDCKDAGPDELVDMDTVTVVNPNDGSPGLVKARAYVMPGCAGDVFTDSDDTAYVYFSGPGKPKLVP